MPDVLLLELEGVLLDVVGPRRVAVREALAAEGVEIADDLLDDCLAVGGLAAVVAEASARTGAALDPTALDLAALRAERALETRLASGLTLAPGASAFVERVLGRARLAVVTGASRRRADAALALAGLESAFECVVTGDDLLHPAPAPDGIRVALERMSRRRAVSAARAVALESSRDGIRAARAAGVRVVAVGAVPPHVAVEANGLLPTLEGATLESVDAVAQGDARVR